MTDEMMHYGTKGMKWGVITWPERRKKRRAAERKDAPRKPKISSKKSSPKKEGKPQNSSKLLSDDELQRRINRLRMEQEYLRLTTPPKQKRATDFIRANIEKGLGTAVSNVTAKSVQTLAVEAIKRGTGVDIDKKTDKKTDKK